MKEIKLKLSDEAFRTLKEYAYASGLAGTDGPLVYAWVKVIDSILEGKTEVELKTRKERENEVSDS